MAQIRLQDMGYPIEVTGYFDHATLNAVNAFKENNKLGNSGNWEGVIGPQTWGLLFGLLPITKRESNHVVKLNSMAIFDGSVPWQKKYWTDTFPNYWSGKSDYASQVIKEKLKEMLISHSEELKQLDEDSTALFENSSDPLEYIL